MQSRFELSGFTLVKIYLCYQKVTIKKIIYMYLSNKNPENPEEIGITKKTMGVGENLNVNTFLSDNLLRNLNLNSELS